MKMKLNRPTAAFFTAAHYLYDGDCDAVGVAYDLVLSTGFTGFGRERRQEAIKKIAPDLALALNEVVVDVLYIYAEDPYMAYRAVAREISRAEKWIAENGTVPVYATMPHWPPGWKYSVWELVNALYLNAEDAALIPLYKEALLGKFPRQKNG